MAEGDVTFYNSFKARLLDSAYAGLLSWDNQSYIITLHTGYTPNIDTDDWSSIAATQYSTGGGYTADAKTLASKTITQDNTGDRGLYDCANVTWTALTLSPATPSHAVIRGLGNDDLMCYIELGTTATNGADFTLAMSSSPAALFTIS